MRWFTDLVPSEVNTRDKKVMLTDSFALWSVTDPLEYLIPSWEP